MAKYTVQSKKTGNTVTVEYDDAGTLVGVEYDGNSDAAATAWMQANLPVSENRLQGWMSNMFTTEAVVETVSFEEFWEQYGKKIGKQQAEKQWAKLTQAERAKAIKNIKKYRLYCAVQAPPRLMKDPERYLSQKTFNDQLSI